MNKDTELLNFIHQNAEMGKNTMTQLIAITDDPAFQEKLSQQLEDYNRVCMASNVLLQSAGHETKGLSPLTKFSTYISVNMNTMSDKSPSHISEMLIQGSTMGIIDMKKAHRVCAEDGCSPEAYRLAGDLIGFCEQYVERLKEFL